MLDAPVCWDNEDDPIPEGPLKEILARIDRALHKKYRRYKLEIGTREENEE